MHAEGVGFDQRGYALADWLGRPLREMLSAASFAELEPRYRAALAGSQQSFEYRGSDSPSVFSVQITPIKTEDGAITSAVAVIQDVTERRDMVEDLSRSDARLRECERMVGLGSWELIPSTGAITYSTGFARLMGIPAGEPLDLTALLGLVHPDDHKIASAAIAECLATGSMACEVRVLGVGGAVSTFAAQGEAVWPLDGRPTFMRGALLDVTQARKAERERLEAVTLFRHGFDASPVGMALTDAGGDRYVRVNDALCRLLGRSRQQLVGASIDSVTHPEDRVLTDGGRRMPPDDETATFEGDMRYLRPDGSVVWATLHLAPVRTSDGSVQGFFSQLVDITERKEREAHFEQDVNDADWLGRIRDAIDQDRLVLYTQPIVDLRTGETVQQELLLRMLGEDGSVIALAEFLPIAERYGLICEIDRWVLRQAVELAAKGEPTQFNLSAASISDPFILRELASAIKETGADPALLVLEVTETAMMNQLDDGRRFAEQVTALGCQLALDDFGTGFASLSYLKRIPARHLKIDIEFVRDLTRDESDERLVRGIIGMAREFDQTTIAEGIEDEATLLRLRELGVHRGQGYLFGRPGPLADAAPASAAVSVPQVHQTPEPDHVSVIRDAFEAFARRDIEALLRVSHPDFVLRPFRGTSARTGRDAPTSGTMAFAPTSATSPRCGRA